jgi:DNA-binding HxlR family transcriptional regulator
MREAAELAGDRWVLLLTAALAEGPRRFGDLAADVEGIAPNVLTDRLRRMETRGLVTAAAYQQRPPRYVYDLSESGRELADLLPALAAWGARTAGVTPAAAPGTPTDHPDDGEPLLWV